MCSLTEIYDTIMELPSKFDSSVDELNSTDKFLLYLTRCLLTGANIIVIYELPSVDDENRAKIMRVLSAIHGLRTLLVFSGQNKYVEIGDKIVEIENGEVKNIQFNAQE